MSYLLQEDLECFKCSLSDCKERHNNCKRKQFINGNKDYKKKIHEYKMLSRLKLQKPIVVR